MEQNYYLITSESILVESQPTMLVSSSLLYHMSGSEVLNIVFVESFYSGSALVFNTSSVVPTDILWSLDSSKLAFSTEEVFTGSYISSFDGYDSLIQWIYDENTDELQYWDEMYDDVINDPYGIDGPFPEEMDETTG